MIQTNLQSTIRSLDTLFTAIRIWDTDSNQQIEKFWKYNAQLRFHEKRFDVRTDRWQWKIKEDSVQDGQRKYEEP